MNVKKMMTGMMFVLISGMGLMSCSTTQEEVTPFLGEIITVDESGITTLDAQGLKDLYYENGGIATDSLQEWILFMREEEKVARDLYLAFSELYTVPVFKNIAKAEQNHMNAVLSLMETYGIEDPVIEENGVFTNEHLQELYNTLLEQGSDSIAGAIKVGALVEEVDIVDLANVYLYAPGDDFKALAEALMLGSRNHLRAFNGHLTFRKITYTPQVLDQEAFNAIVNSPWEVGSGLCRGILTTDGIPYPMGCGWWKGN